jgi:hypothetical protein
MRTTRFSQFVALTLMAVTVVTIYGSAAATDSAMAPVRESRGDIVVHGHWEIEVSNPDGARVTRREFDNALTALGQKLLVLLLARTMSAGPWEIGLSGAPSPCLPTDPAGCIIFDPFFKATRKNANLTVTNEPLKLSGFIDVTEAGSIDTVQTMVWTCSSSTAPSACKGVTNVLDPFSQAAITSIPVVKGQRVTVTVTFSFSSAP